MLMAENPSTWSHAASSAGCLGEVKEQLTDELIGQVVSVVWSGGRSSTISSNLPEYHPGDQELLRGLGGCMSSAITGPPRR
jgi:hypothetical protein